MNKKWEILFLVLIILFAVVPLQKARSQDVKDWIKAATEIQKKMPREILYLHMDKPDYIIGDSIWISAYLMNAYNNEPSKISSIAYIELISPSGTLITRQAIHLYYGVGFTQIPLKKDLSPGTFQIRAYTRWMENFSDSLFFRQKINLIGGEKNWSMDIAGYRQWQSPNKDSVFMKLKLSDQFGQAAKYKTVIVEIEGNKRTPLISKRLMTREDGSLPINFNLRNNSGNKNLSLVIRDEIGTLRISYPLNFYQTKPRTDFQLLPESGHLLEGVQNHVAFKSVDAAGRGQNVRGVLEDSYGHILDSISDTHNGMGAFNLTPRPGTRYYVRLNTGDTVRLPKADASGTTLQVDCWSIPLKIDVTIKSSADQKGSHYLLFGKYKGLILYGGRMTVKDTVVHIYMDKDIFPTGICSFYLLKADGQLVNQRNFFLDHHDRLNIQLSTASDKVLTRDSVGLQLQVTDQNEQPVSGVYSVAITDISQVKKDPVKDRNILSYFLLGADIKGWVQDPGYYFSDTTAIVRRARDLLMLTQGFVRYDWDTTRTIVPAERDFEISGKATNILGKPVKKGMITLLSTNKQIIIKDTLTDENGQFCFTGFPMFDTAAFVVQARNKKNRSFGIGIELDKYNFPAVSQMASSDIFSIGNINLDTSLKNQLRASGIYRKQKYGPEELMDVVVTANSSVEGSDNLNGPGGYDQAILENELRQMGDSSLLQILTSKIKGFHDGICNAKDKDRYYMLNHQKIRFIFDGIKLDFYYNDKDNQGQNDPYYWFVKQYLDYYTAKDIKGIEIMESGKYTAKYLNHYLDLNELINYNASMGCPYIFIEITTYGKVGPFVKHNATIATLRPQPFSYGKVFYEPKYKDRITTDSLPDLRSTIYWNPAIFTGPDGKASISFYSAATPGEYLIWIEGTDLKGHFGYKVKKVRVEED